MSRSERDTYMSIAYYIASNKELPLGEFGMNRTKMDKESKGIRIINYKTSKGHTPLKQVIDLSHIKDDEIEVYDSVEDVAGIYVQSVEAEGEALKKHFPNPFIYEVSPSWGKFFLKESMKD